MTRILVDADLVLDVLLDRRPQADAASAVWSAVERDRIEGLLAAHTLTDVHDQISRSAGPARAAELTAALLTVFGIAGIDEAVLRAALSLGLHDLGDAIVVAAAQRAKCVAIVTRHSRRFAKSPLRVLTPDEAAAWLAAQTSSSPNP